MQEIILSVISFLNEFELICLHTSIASVSTCCILTSDPAKPSKEEMHRCK